MFIENVFPSIILDFNTSKNWVDYCAAIGPTIMAGIAVWVAYRQARTVKKQTKINEQQFEINKQQLEFNKQQMAIQRCNFIHSNIIKEKQDKLLELRRRFLEFKELNLLFLSILFPSCIADKKQNPGLPPKYPIDIDEKDSLASYYIDSQEIPNNLIEKASKVNAGFYKFLNDNEVFLNDNAKLYLYLQRISYGFSEFFKEFITKKDLYKEFNILINYLARNINLHAIFTYNNANIILTLRKIRKYFYTAIRFQFCIDEGGINEHILYRASDSIFKLKKLRYDEVKWSKSDKIAFFTHSTFIGWFQFWQDNIDSFFSSVFEDIHKIRNNSKID